MLLEGDVQREAAGLGGRRVRVVEAMPAGVV
jgi:hypothetical protein